MSKPSTSALASTTDLGSLSDDSPSDDLSSGEQLLRTFNDVHEELVSTLWFMLGNQEDAQDVAQEAFLRCWRNPESLQKVQNLRAWIFRVGMNAAKDLQRSAWRRRVKPLIGAEIMPMSEAALQMRSAIQKLRQVLASGN